MAEQCFSSEPSMSTTHKRSLDDMEPELGSRPVGTSRSSSVGTSSSPEGSRESNKRPRNDSESEVDEILVSSNSLSSSSSSSGSLDSYHSARSSFTDNSPPLLPADDSAEDQLIHDPSVLLGSADDSNIHMDDFVSFLTLPHTNSPPPNVPPPLPPTGPQGNLARLMERANAFNRDISPLRQSPVRTSDDMWHSWTSSSSYSYMSAHEISDAYLEADWLRQHMEQPSSRLNLGANDESVSDLRRRLSTYERDAARQGELVGRSRARQEQLHQLLGNSEDAHESEPSTRHNSSPRRCPYYPWPETSASADGPREPPAPPRHHSPPARLSGTSQLHSFVDGFWRRETDRSIQDQFERTMRETEAHTERVAGFLAESGPSRSSFSTLSGALDEGHIGHRAHLSSSRRGSRLSTRPHTDFSLGQTRVAPRQPVTESLPTWDSSNHEMYGWGPYDSLLFGASTQGFDSTPRSQAESYIETSRDRSVDLSDFRQRARPPQRPSTPPASAPTPPHPQPPSTDSSFLYRSESVTRSMLPLQRRPRNHLFQGAVAPRTPTDDAMLQSFTDHMQPPSPSSAAQYSSLPSDSSYANPDTAQRQYGHFDLNAYRAGPFRATLARSMALQGQSTAPRVHRSTRLDMREHMVQRYNLSSLSDSDDGDGLLPRSHASQHSIESVRDSLRSTVRPSGAPSQVVPVMSSGSDEHHERAPYTQHDPWAPFLSYNSHSGERSMPQTDRLRELLSRPTAVSPPPTRHRSLLERDRATRRHEMQDQELSVRSREQRRETVRRMSARRALGPNPSVPTPPSASHSTEGPSLASSHQQRIPRRFTSIPLASSHSHHAHAAEIRTEQRPPLNGRFARPRGFASHFPADMVLVDFPDARLPPHGRRRNLGDYIRDEDMDMSYEGLLSLSSILGDVKPRGTPADIISSLPKGTYGEWARSGATDERCPICLDDYDAKDACLRVPKCSHWFHDGCLQQWLKTARTCPVCRGRVTKPRFKGDSAHAANPSGLNTRNEDDDDESDRDGARTPQRPPWRHN